MYFQESLHITCANDEFQCKNKKECIPEHKFCDGTIDCIDDSDEFFNCQKQVSELLAFYILSHYLLLCLRYLLYNIMAFFVYVLTVKLH